ncbi:hypothetical protein [Delftia lacustris]|uniref:Uncharacterized protein n=2 Tax=Delftia TaxID=80865 RepID=A0A1H3QU48_9BURK|nr:hypothetical protein [Delftia lacustris]SDZ16581.1 hypothetical protein SAMN05421547_113129 [Delftia lacustris]
MSPTEIAALLKAAPERHGQQCMLAADAIQGRRWPTAAALLRTQATMVQEWADQARVLATWCEAEAESGRVHSTVPTALECHAPADLLGPAGAPTLESLEAGLLALAHGLGREHAARVRRAMNGVLQAAHAPAALPPQAAPSRRARRRAGQQQPRTGGPVMSRQSIRCLWRLMVMRRSTGAGPIAALRWAAGLLWRNHLTSQRRKHLDRRAEVERAARQRL